VSVVNLVLVAWQKRWELDSAVVRCRSCRGAQRSELSCEPFNERHDARCAARSSEPQYPWLDLAKILQDQVDAGIF
jgi:hypothetical protein